MAEPPNNPPPTGPIGPEDEVLYMKLIWEELRYQREERDREREAARQQASDSRSVISGTGEQVSSVTARARARSRDDLRAQEEGFANRDEWAQQRFGAANWEEMYNAQIDRSRRAGYGAGGVLNRLTNYQFATGRGTSAALSGIGRSVQGGRLGQIYNVGEALYSSYSNTYAAENAFAEMGVEERRSLLYRDTAASREVALGLTPDESWTVRERRAYERLQQENLEPQEIRRSLYNLRGRMFAGGSDISPLLESQNPIVRSIASRVAPEAEGFAGMMARGGGLMMAGARLAGPVAMAIGVAQQAYGFTKGTLYDPARSAAGLGYGFSYNPFSEGYQTSLGRSIQTRADALFSMGISPQQTAAARAAIEGMGLGGPGSERAYDSYYGSMTDVIQNTQLSAQTLAPFYEQFMRQGGTTSELENLTRLLRDELPKAAAASSMSLDQMATSLQATVQAAMQQPLNARTSMQITQQGIAAAQAGGFKTAGLQAIASGANMNINMIAANQNNVPFVLVRNRPGLLLQTAAAQVQEQLGDVKDARDFDQKIQTDPNFAYRVSMLQNLYGLNPDDIRNLVDVGLTDYQNAGVLADLFAGQVKKDTKSISVRPRPAGARGIGAPVNRNTSEQFLEDPRVLGGGRINLTTGTKQDIINAYAGQIDTLEKAIKASGGNVKNFENELKAISGDPGSARETWEFLTQKQKDLQEKLKRSGNQSNVAITVDLTDSAKQLVKTKFGKAAPNPNGSNSLTGIGTTVALLPISPLGAAAAGISVAKDALS